MFGFMGVGEQPQEKAVRSHKDTQNSFSQKRCGATRKKRNQVRFQIRSLNKHEQLAYFSVKETSSNALFVLAALAVK